MSHNNAARDIRAFGDATVETSSRTRESVVAATAPSARSSIGFVSRSRSRFTMPNTKVAQPTLPWVAPSPRAGWSCPFASPLQVQG